MAADTGLYVAREKASFTYEGQPFMLEPGTIARAGHPIMKGREGLFAPLTVDFEVEQAPAAPPQGKAAPAKDAADGKKAAA
jgi:hypothetical protein